MTPYIEFIGALQNSGFWLVKVDMVSVGLHSMTTLKSSQNESDCIVLAV